jgi:hypothetical protein
MSARYPTRRRKLRTSWLNRSGASMLTMWPGPGRVAVGDDLGDLLDQLGRHRFREERPVEVADELVARLLGRSEPRLAALLRDLALERAQPAGVGRGEHERPRRSKAIVRPWTWTDSDPPPIGR